MKKKIRLTESQLHKVIKESVNKLLTELDWKTYANAERKWADTLFKRPNHPKRKSSVAGHRHSLSLHDIYTDDRLRDFQQARQDAFNRDYGYNYFGAPETVKNTGFYTDDTKGSYEMDFPYQDTGMKGYYDRIRTKTRTPGYDSKGRKRPAHNLEDTFQLNNWDNTEDSPKTKHQTKVDHVDGRYAPGTLVDRDAVEPAYDNIPYMKARNRGNADIEKYQSGKSKYIKGKGWE